MDNDFINSYIYEKNIICEENKDEELNKEDNENEENKKIKYYKKLYSLCENEDHLHICCGIIFSLSFYSFIF